MYNHICACICTCCYVCRYFHGMQSMCTCSCVAETSERPFHAPELPEWPHWSQRIIEGMLVLQDREERDASPALGATESPPNSHPRGGNPLGTRQKA